MDNGILGGYIHYYRRSTQFALFIILSCPTYFASHSYMEISLSLF